MEDTFKILCPTDFSECSLNAIEYATRLGEKFNAQLVLLHVLNREDYLKLSPADHEGTNQVAFITEKLRNLQQAVLDEGLKNGLKSCDIVYRDGDVVNETLDLAVEIQTDLIVAGTEGMNELREQVMGSRASRMVEQVDRDILIVPRKVYFKAPRKIVYASDYVEEDKLAIQKVVEMARVFESEVDVLHISSSQKALDRSLHMTMVDEIKPFVRYDRINYVLKPCREDLALGLENYLQLAKGDILVTLSKKKSFFEQIFSKNLSKKMSYFLSKPLWVIKTF